MGYMLPLRFINVSKSPKVAICATRIVAMMSTEIYQARRTIHDEKKSGSLINACGTSAAKTAIILDNGAVVSSPLSISILMNAIERSNIKAKVKSKNNARLKVYDVYDEEPSEEMDELVSEISGFEEEEDQEEEIEEDEEFDE